MRKAERHRAICKDEVTRTSSGVQQEEGAIPMSAVGLIIGNSYAKAWLRRASNALSCDCCALEARRATRA